MAESPEENNNYDEEVILGFSAPVLTAILRRVVRRVMSNNVPFRANGEDWHLERRGNPSDDLREHNTFGMPQEFDRSLAASHSYMGPGLVAVRRSSIIEAGWQGTVPVVAYHGTVFPGETVPMLLSNIDVEEGLANAIQRDKLFGLIIPDEKGRLVSGYGVLCEVFEASFADDEATPTILKFKARANHRFRLAEMPKDPMDMDVYSTMSFMDVVVLPEFVTFEPLHHVRLNSLDSHRSGKAQLDKRLRNMDAAVTSWPLFVYDIFDYDRMRKKIADYFKTIKLDKLPKEAVALSFWVASNLMLAPCDRYRLFVQDDAIIRLQMAVRLLNQKFILCCKSCKTEVTQREHIFAMSSDGVHSNYTNLGGYMHDIVTVKSCVNVALTGTPSEEYSWFPGYAWSIVLCRVCAAHVGWRFQCLQGNLYPENFYGLSRNYVEPQKPDNRTTCHTMPLETNALRLTVPRFPLL